MERQLGASEENWTRCTAGGTGIGVFGIALLQAMDQHRILAAAKATCDKHAVLRSHIVRSSSKASKLQVREDFSPVVESMPWPLDLELGGDESHPLSRELHHIATNELNLPFSRQGDQEAVDVFQVHFYVEPSGTGSVIVLRIHSGACDRHSSSIVAQEFLTALNAAAGFGGDPENAGDKDHLLPAMEDLLPKSKASKGFFKKGLDAVGYALNSSKCSLLPFQPGFDKQQAPFRSEFISFNLGQPGTEQLLSACKNENTSVAAALSAAFLKTAANVKELKQKKLDTFSFTKVLNSRPYFEPPLGSTVVGNYSAGLPQDVQVKDSVPFWDLARHISEATDKSLAKSHQFSELSVLNMLLSQVLKHPSITPSSSMRTALFTLFVDGPADCDWKDVGNLSLAGTVGPMASMHLIGPCFTVAESLLPGPELVLSFIYATPMHSREQLEDFVRTSFDILKESA